jgi:hypothetical protein
MRVAAASGVYRAQDRWAVSLRRAPPSSAREAWSTSFRRDPARAYEDADRWPGPATLREPRLLTLAMIPVVALLASMLVAPSMRPLALGVALLAPPMVVGTMFGSGVMAVLAAILAERGTLSLDFLADLPPHEARRYLTSLPGVGPKTAACVQVFCLGQPALPVDTHVHRVARRLGLIRPTLSADAAHEVLERAVPPPLRYAFHVLLIWHGRQVCRAPKPRCDACVLLGLCPRVGVAANVAED